MNLPVIAAVLIALLGSEPTAALLEWCALYLAEHPSLQRRLREEEEEEGRGEAAVEDVLRHAQGTKSSTSAWNMTQMLKIENYLLVRCVLARTMYNIQKT